MSATDLLDRWFESPVVKGFMAVNGIIGTWAGPDAPGTAYVLMHHSVGDIGDGQIASWGYPEGGMGAVSTACEDSARFFGAEIRTNARVGRVLTTRRPRARRGAARTARSCTAPLVVTAIHPKITFLEQLQESELPEEFVHDIRHWKTRSGTVKINLARGELPEFTADPGLRPAGARRRDPDPRRRRLPRARVPGGALRQGRHAAVQRHGDPHGVRQDARARGRARGVDVHAVGPQGVGARRTATTPSSRPTPTG